MVDGTYNIVSHVSLDDNLVLSLRIFGDTTTRCELACELLGCLFEIYTEEFETMNMGLMFSFRPL
jgi:hypothetical protein